MISPASATSRSDAASEGWLSRWKLLLLLAVFVVMGFPSVVIGMDSFFYRDMGLFGYPLAEFHRAAFWRGELPLWNPYNNCGLPFFAQWNTLVLYPGALLYLLLPLPHGMNVFVIAHLFLAAAGAYSLGLRWTGHRFAASVAGLAFAWNGLTLHCLMWPNNMAALGWMPWVILGLERAWEEGGRRLGWAVLAGALQMLSGAPEMILLTWIVAGALGLRAWLGAPGRRGAMAGRFFLVGGVVALVCAVQLLPFLDLLAHSNRDSGFGGAAWAMPWWGLANFLVPMFGCTPSIVGVYSQDAQQWTSSYYLGIGPIGFALLAWWSKDSRARWLAGLAALGLLLALGDAGGVYAALKKLIPALGFIRFPIKYVVLVMFALPFLAALGLAGVMREKPGPTLSRSPLSLVSTILVGVLLILVVLAWMFPVAKTSPTVITENGVTRLLFGAGLFGALMFLKRQAPRPWHGWVGLAMLAVMGADVLTHMPRQNPVMPNSGYGPMGSLLSEPPKLGSGRAMIAPPMQSMLEGAATANALAMYRGHRQMLMSDANLLDRVPKVNGFFSLYLKEADEVTRRLYKGTNDSEPLLDFLGVSQVSDRRELFLWHARSNALPLITAGQKPVVWPAGKTLEAVLAPSFQPREVTFFAEESASVLNKVVHGQARVLSQSWKPERVEAEIEAGGESVVVVAQAWARGWQAKLDGARIPLFRANHAYQAVTVPAGKHRLELTYQEPTLRLGAGLSLLGAVVLGLLLSRPRQVSVPS